jgi:hypothetical protein
MGNGTSQMKSSFKRLQKVNWNVVINTTNEWLGMGIIDSQ